MPVISITMGEATREQKKQLISELTQNAVEITGLPAQSFTVTINELPFDSLGVGGKTIEELHREKTG